MGSSMTDKASSEPSLRGSSNKDPMHDVKLEQLLKELVAEYGWDGLYQRIPVNCFKTDPSIKSSLKFLRKTPWARQKVESLYLKLKGFSTSKRATKTETQLVSEVKKSIQQNKDTSSASVKAKTEGIWAAARKNLAAKD